MIEKITMEYLERKLTVPVSMEVPDKKKSYVVIERTGGSKSDHVFSATLAIQSVAPSLIEAAELNEAVKEAMEQIEELDEVSSCSLNADYNFTDTETKKYRYQAVFDLIHY